MTRMTLSRTFLLFLSMACSAGAAADVLLIEQVRQAGRMDVPANGLSMSEVEASYGTPQDKQAAVGDPPISRWLYDRWSVYFEYDRVLYSVIHEGEVIEGVSQPEPAGHEEAGEDAGEEAGEDAGAEAESTGDSESS